MGGVFQAIGDWIGQTVNNIVGFVEALFTDPFNALLDYIIEPIMNFLGFHDEDIYRTNVIAAKVYNEDTLTKTQLRQALDYMKKDSVDAIKYAKNFANVGDAQFGKFYRHGKWDYLDYLPDAKISAVTVPVQNIENILKSIKGTDVFITDILAMVPYDEDWCKWKLQEQYGYNIGEDFLNYNGEYYKYSKNQYNADNNTFRVTLVGISPIRERLYETVTTKGVTQSITVNTSQRTDITLTYLSESFQTKETKITEIKQYKYGNTDLGTFETVLSSTTETVQIGTVTPSSMTTPVTTTTESHLLKVITTTRSYLYTREDTGSALKETNPVTVSTTYEIAFSPVTESEVINIISNQLQTHNLSPIVLNIANHNNIKCYVVKYTTTNNGRLYYWIYNPASGTYPNLNNPAEQIIGFNMFPVIMLRNNFFNVNDYDKSSINGVSRPPTITKQRYEDTVDILNSIGISLEELTKGYSENSDISHVQDAFFLLGVVPSNKHWVVSRVLYELFDFVYDTVPFVTTSSGYSAMFRENPYNAAIAWTPSPIVLKTEKIGSLGTCTHRINSTTTTIITSTVREITATNSTNASLGRAVNVVEYELKETYDSADGLIASEKLNVKTTVVYPSTTNNPNNYTVGYHKTEKNRTTSTAKQLIVKKQISITTTKTLSMKSFTSFNIIRRGVENGGVSLDVDNENLVIPLPVEVVARLTLMEKTALLGESAYMLFYAFQHQHIKWYQTEAFGNFLQIVSIGITVIVTIFSFGTGSLASMTLSSILLSVLKSVAIGVGLQLALKLVSSLVDDIGLKIALSVAAMALAMYAGGAFDNFNFSTAVSLVEMPVKAINMYTQDLMNKLQGNMQDFTEEYQRRSERNEELIKSLNSGLNVADITELTTSSHIDDTSAVIMSPDDFFQAAISAFYNFDSLYTGFYNSTVHDFVGNCKRLGVQDDG